MCVRSGAVVGKTRQGAAAVAQVGGEIASWGGVREEVGGSRCVKRWGNVWEAGLIGARVTVEEGGHSVYSCVGSGLRPRSTWWR